MNKSDTNRQVKGISNPVIAIVLKWQIHPILPSQGLGPFREIWDDLLGRLWGQHPMLGADFIEGLLHNFATEHSIYLAVGTDPSGVVGAMCLLESAPTRRFVWRSFLPSQMQIGPTLVAESQNLSSLFDALPWYVLQVDLMRNDPHFGDLVVREGMHPNSVWSNRTMSIRLDGDFETYCAERPIKLRQNLRRYQRRLADAHEMRFIALSSSADLASAVARYSVLEAAGWKGRTGTAVTSDKNQLQFYSEVLAAFAKRAGALAFEIWAGSQLIASRLALVEGDMVVMLKTSYNEDFSEFAPGNTLLTLTLQHLFMAYPGKTVEFYTNVTRDQQFWCTATRDICHVSLYRFEATAELLRAASSGLGKLEPSLDPELSTYCCDKPEDLPADVLGLLNNVEKISVEAGAAWFLNYCQAVRDPAMQPAFHVLSRRGRAVAVLPLALHRHSLGVDVVALGNYYTALYVPAIEKGVEAIELAVLLGAIKKWAGQVAKFRFAPMDPTSREYTLLRAALQSNGLLNFSFLCFGNWYLPGLHSWSNYLASRNGKTRTALKRYGKRFLAASGRIEIITEPDKVAEGIEAFEQVYALSWKLREPYPEFIGGLITTAARKGWLRLGVAWLEDRPVAAQFWMVAHGRAEIYKLAHDEAHKEWSAGTLLTGALMAHVMDIDKVTEVDYLIGDDPYKVAWVSMRRERWGLVAYNFISLRGFGGFFSEVMGRVFKLMRLR